jgi:hypothetical protein
MDTAVFAKRKLLCDTKKVSIFERRTLGDWSVHRWKSQRIKICTGLQIFHRFLNP